MKIYIAIWQDRHTDTTARAFYEKEKAIEWARDAAKRNTYRPEDYYEADIDGWEFYATYSTEDDCIYVIESEIE